MFPDAAVTPEDFMNDNPCCWACRTPYGCGRPECEHHIKARQQQDADDRARRVIRRPTEDKAIANVMREKRRQERK